MKLIAVESVASGMLCTSSTFLIEPGGCAICADAGAAAPAAMTTPRAIGPQSFVPLNSFPLRSENVWTRHLTEMRYG